MPRNVRVVCVFLSFIFRSGSVRQTLRQNTSDLQDKKGSAAKLLCVQLICLPRKRRIETMKRKGRVNESSHCAAGGWLTLRRELKGSDLHRWNEAETPL